MFSCPAACSASGSRRTLQKMSPVLCHEFHTAYGTREHGAGLVRVARAQCGAERALGGAAGEGDNPPPEPPRTRTPGAHALDLSALYDAGAGASRGPSRFIGGGGQKPGEGMTITSSDHEVPVGVGDLHPGELDLRAPTIAGLDRRAGPHRRPARLLGSRASCRRRADGCWDVDISVSLGDGCS